MRSEETSSGEGLGAEPNEPSARFRAVTTILIGVVAVLAAVVAWRSAVISIRAEDLNEDGLLELLHREQIQGRLNAAVEHDLALLAEYQEHVLASQLLARDAQQVRGRNAGLALELEKEARSEMAISRALLPFFRGGPPTIDHESGEIVYDEESVRAFLAGTDDQLQELSPESSFRQSAKEYERSVNLVLVGALAVAALLFLTVAQFTRPSLRRIFAVSGIAVALVCVALFLVLGF